jgi:hypothetical protein
VDFNKKKLKKEKRKKGATWVTSSGFCMWTSDVDFNDSSTALCVCGGKGEEGGGGSSELG